MAKDVKRMCPGCNQEKEFRADQKTCGCKPTTSKDPEVSEITGNTWAISLPQTRIHTLEQLVEYCEIDLSIWEVERFIANKWEMNAGEGRVEPLFQIKAFLKKRQDIVDAKEEITQLKKLAKLEARIPVPVEHKSPSSGNMLEIDISDHHFGKLAWSTETGHENYDTKIAVKVFKRAFKSLLQRSAQHTFDEIWFVVGNDLLNSDNVAGTTTKGTYVSTDVRYHKTFSIVRKVLTDCIEDLRHHTKKVKVIMVPGNHDQLSAWHLGDSLECYFDKYKDIEIDNSPRYYKYHQFGKVMIMYTHGDKGKRKDYPLLMATEQPEMFGSTKFREAHTGHRHTTQVDEQHGVIVRILSALCPPDAWHAENAFTGNLRSSEAFHWNKNEGLIGTAIYTDSVDNIEAD